MKVFSRTFLSLSFITAALTCLPAQAAEISTELKKNADILRTILQTAFKDSESSRLSSIQTSYLSSQGLLFQANTSGRGHAVFHFDGPDIPMPPPPPAGDIDAVFEYQVEFDTDDMESWADAAREMAEEQRQLHRQSYRLVEKQREIDSELREVERDLRDIEFNKSLGKADKEQQQELAKLQQMRKSLLQKQTEVQNEVAVSRKQAEEQRVKTQEARQKQTAALVKAVSEKFTQVLCDYGASLRELSDNEHVTLQINHRGSRERHYWVVKKSDINQCVTGKIKAKDLLAKTATYRF